MSQTRTKEYIAQTYFGDIKVKHIKHFKATTPQGNIIEGFICKKANHFLGSMVILTINDHEVEQFVHAMPKIHYWDKFHSMYEENDFGYPCYEKLDGSCLILYGLYIDGELIEIVPKTRGVPVADPHIIELYNELDHSNTKCFFEQNKDYNPTLLFELYGALNLHSIQYPSVRIDTKLIGGSFNGELCTDYELQRIAYQYDYNRPNRIFKLFFYKKEWSVIIKNGIYFHYLMKEFSKEEEKELLKRRYPTQYDAINAIKEFITIINRNHYAAHGRPLLEGVCVNTFDVSGNKPMYLKIKSADIEEKCRTENGIPRKFILKEVYKYFDEYESNAKEIYKDDPNHSYNYIIKNLSEEFSQEAIENKRTKNRIRNVFLDVLESKQPPTGLQEICQSIVDEYPGQECVDYIRLFAQQYPEKKRQGRIAFSIFESLLRGN